MKSSGERRYWRLNNIVGRHIKLRIKSIIKCQLNPLRDFFFLSFKNIEKKNGKIKRTEKIRRRERKKNKQMPSAHVAARKYGVKARSVRSSFKVIVLVDSPNAKNCWCIFTVELFVVGFFFHMKFTTDNNNKMPLFLLVFLLVAPESRIFSSNIAFHQTKTFPTDNIFTHLQQVFGYFTPLSVHRTTQHCLQSQLNESSCCLKGQSYMKMLTFWLDDIQRDYLTSSYSTWRHVCLIKMLAHTKNCKKKNNSCRKDSVSFDSPCVKYM